MQLDGSFRVDVPRSKVWTAVHDPSLLAQCVPGCEEAEQIGDTTYRAVVRVKVGPISARFTLMVEIVEEVEPERIRIKAQGEEGSRASMLSADSELTLVEAAPGATEVAWSSNVTLSGRLGKYGMGLLKKKAQSLSEEFVKNFSTQLNSGEGVA